ncbi:MAG: RDD family protein [Victivallaceae bacterium]
MKFIYIDRDGNQQGPVDQTAIERAIRNGELNADTAVRNAMLRDFRTIREFECFEAVLAETPAAKAAAEAIPTDIGVFTRLLRAADPRDRGTAFEYKFAPYDVSATRRCCSALFDMLVLGVVAALLFGYTFKQATGGKIVTVEAPQDNAVAAAATTPAEPPAPAPQAAAAPAPAEPVVRSGAPDTPGGRAARMISKTLVKVEALNARHNADVEREVAAPPSPSSPVAAPPAATTPAAPAAVDASKQTGERDEITELADKFIPKELPKVTLHKATLNDDTLEMYLSNTELLKVNRAEFQHAFIFPTVLFLLLVLLYYSLSLGIFAQTIGMWFWGIFLAKTDTREVFFLRALAYSVFLVLFGIVMIPMVKFTRRSLADWVCGVRQLSVASGGGK